MGSQTRCPRFSKQQTLFKNQRYDKRHISKGRICMKEKMFPSALWSLNPDTDYGTDAISGQMSFDGKSYFKLDIPAGILLDYPKIPTADGYMQCHTLDGLHADCVYGFSQTGDYYLLRDVASPGPCFAAPGFQKQSLTGASLFISKQRIENNPTVKSVSVKIPGLREWVGTVPFATTSTFDEGRIKELTFNFNISELENLTLYENDKLAIYVSFICTRKGGKIPSFEFSFESDCKLNFEYKQSGLSFEETLDLYVFPITSFLAFCMGFRQAISSTGLITDKGISGEYFAPFTGVSEAPSNRQLDSIPLPYKRIKDRTSEMIARWLEFDEYARNSSTLVTSLMNDWRMPLDMQFLASAQAFEAASRSGVDEREITDEALRGKLEAINASNMNSRLRGWVIHKVKNAKWKSANSLANDLVQKLGAYSTYVAPDISRFMQDHRCHRDAYTHRRDIGEEQRLSNVDLFRHTEATQLLAYGSIALFLGIEPEELIDAFKESRYRWNSIHRANRLYAIEMHGDSSQSTGEQHPSR